MSQLSAPFHVTSSLGKERSSRAWGFASVIGLGDGTAVALAPFLAVEDASRIAQTSRGAAESSRRKTSVSPFPSIDGAPFTSGPLVSASTFPSSVVRYRCSAVFSSAEKSTDRLSGVQTSLAPKRPPIDSSAAG